MNMLLKPVVQETINEIRSDIDPVGLSVSPWTETPPTIDDVLKEVKKLGEKRDYVIKTILAVYVSTFMDNANPLWLMIVGNPSSNKTTLVDLLKKRKDVYRLDTMTSNPFSSGQREKEKPKDLLPLLNGKCFVIKEYGTLFGRSDEMVKQLISDFVAIYDGEYSKHSPTRGTVKILSYFSHIGCVTPMALNSRQRYMNAVGARFLFLRIKPLTYEEKKENLDAIWTDNNINKNEIIEVVDQYCDYLKNKALEETNIRIPSKIKTKLNNLAQLTARARGIVITNSTTFKNEEGKTIRHYEVDDIQIEEPFRALKQLKKLAESLALVNGNEEIGEDEISIVKKIVLSSMHVRRADILDVFHKGRIFTAKRAAEKLGKNYKTTKRHLDELVALKILKKSQSDNELATSYTLEDEFIEIFNPPKHQAEDIADHFGGTIINS